MNANTKKLAVMAMFTAIAAALITLVHFPLFPAAAFLQYDPADVPILICAFAYGPAAGLAVTLIASFIQAFFLGGDGIYGFLMHVIATGTLTLTASLLYRRKHTRVGAVAGLICGTLAMGLVMLLANHFITPFFLQVPAEMVDSMLLPIILPFNLLKAGINSLLTFFVYKPISRFVIHGDQKQKACS
jgi:riboflavin transporter FmnP